MKEINLEKILGENIILNLYGTITKIAMIKAMREACNQAIELCAEEAETQYEEVEQCENSYVWLRDYPEVSKDSILKVKEVIK